MNTLIVHCTYQSLYLKDKTDLTIHDKDRCRTGRFYLKFSSSSKEQQNLKRKQMHL